MIRDEPFSFVVAGEEEDTRLDLLVAARHPSVSRSTIQKWIEEGRVQVDGKIQKSSFSPREGQRVEVTPAPPEPTRVVPEDLPIEVLYEDESILVVNKPSGMVVHPGAGNRRGTLANALAFHLSNVSRAESLRPGIVHRLDKATSGILVVAKSDLAHDRLSRQFKSRSVHKVYLALVRGHLKTRKGRIELPIGRDRKSRIRISPRTDRPRNAITDYFVLRYYRHFTFLEVRPVTGRTHQIRVHMKQLGHPVAGDELYSGPSRPGMPEPERLFLHATRLSLEHPDSRSIMTFEAPLAEDLRDFLDRLDC